MKGVSISPRPAPQAPPTSRDIGTIRDVNQHIACRLKTLRLSKGRTQTDLGTVVGKTHQQMARYEQGISKIAPALLWKLATYFEVDIAYFFGDLDQDLPIIDPYRAVRQTARKRLQLELIRALDAVADERLLRSLRDFLLAPTRQNRDA